MKTDNKTSAQIKIELLQSAKRTLKRIPIYDDFKGICYCLEISASDRDKKLSSIEQDNAHRLTNYIQVQLGSAVWLTGWLYDNNLIPRWYGQQKFVRKARLQWIDWMIDSLQTYGDAEMRRKDKRDSK